jgi:hypothetical protein
MTLHLLTIQSHYIEKNLKKNLHNPTYDPTTLPFPKFSTLINKIKKYSISLHIKKPKEANKLHKTIKPLNNPWISFPKILQPTSYNS